MNERVVPWFGLGREIKNAKSVKNALKETKTDWKVESRQLYYEGDNDKIIIPGQFANVRMDNGAVLGKVSEKYYIVQNDEALSIMDYMIPEGLELQAGGTIGDGKIWVVGKFGTLRMGKNEDVETYLIFTNSHDGKGSAKICITPVRAACQNALGRAFSGAYRSWSIAHISSAAEKLQAVKEAVGNIGEYNKQFVATANRLMDIKMSEGALENNLALLFPTTSLTTEGQEKVIMERRNNVRDIFLNAPDLKAQKNGWGFVNAVSDYATHYLPEYDEEMYRTSMFKKVIAGHPLIDRAFDLLSA